MPAQPSKPRTEFWRILLPLCALLAGGGCGEATVKPISWVQHPPREHRAVAESCLGGADAGGATDAGGLNGQCNLDSDCAGGKPCACNRACGASGALTNVCLIGSNCRVDSDCTGGAAFCSLSLVPAQECNTATGTFATGYFCHTPGDSCADDSDCNGSTRCLFHRAEERWVCG